MPNSEDILSNSDEIGAYIGLGRALTLRSVKTGMGAFRAPERRFLAVYQMHLCVNNGGFYCYFTGPSADLAADALLGLKEMKAHNVHDLLALACSVFPGGIVPLTQVEREVYLQAGTQGPLSDDETLGRCEVFLNPIDKQFFNCSEPLVGLAVAYARKNVREFQNEVAGD